ncbi:sulfurtransferase complex subunit TusB [Vibrio hangzhouensis]|uniref:tRNA 2-thiouridine synthesizing protein B n=1 Tax=Vibrio hangzhouensis TaxID=462991 RepID=A0A1H6CKC8_9VIBR|nr:sulfurtransferase complex subunit TusB [Vibrio hangzhouensis]SEG72876.1 tRNA 2-thiouridine synthesizing protein B [Vibrio hangzhouensis]
MLHIIKSETGYQSARQYLNQGDDVLLIESASYIPTTTELDDRCGHYSLKEDLVARGLSIESTERTQVVDFNGFVDLTERHVASTTWE